MWRPSSCRGAAAVELACVLVPLMMLVLGAVEFARAVWVYDQLTKAVRDGARYLSFFDPAVAAEYPTAAVKQRMLYGSVNPAAGASTVVPGLTADMIQICDRMSSSACPGEVFGNVATGAGSINLVKVSIVGFRYTSVFPLADRFPAVSFEPISATMRQVYP